MTSASLCLFLFHKTWSGFPDGPEGAGKPSDKGADKPSGTGADKPSDKAGGADEVGGAKVAGAKAGIATPGIADGPGKGGKAEGVPNKLEGSLDGAEGVIGSAGGKVCKVAVADGVDDISCLEGAAG